MKRLITSVLVILLAAVVFAGCGSVSAASETNGAQQATVSASASVAQAPTPAAPTEQKSSFDSKRAINVVSREEGSGTRGAFIELFGVQVKTDSGNRDMTTKEAVIVNKTDVMMTNVSGDTYAIGYISLGSLNDTVKALDIDGVKASAANVKNGTYKISRPFNIAYKGDPEGLAKDFIDFILSKEGQDVVDASYITIDDAAPAFAGNKPAGKIVVAGSSSVTPIMEKLKESYLVINPAAAIDIQMSDSTAGMTGAIDGTCDIGMASRELKDSEKAALSSVEIALDGIAVIVNNQNANNALTAEAVRGIYTGKLETWNEAK